jgi:hypothetical protein
MNEKVFILSKKVKKMGGGEYERLVYFKGKFLLKYRTPA